VWVVVLVADQDALTCPAHAMFLIVLFESLQAREYGGVFFWLAIFGTERVVAQRVEAYGLGLFCIEVLGEDGAETCQR
jgi:hypothetical protein